MSTNDLPRRDCNVFVTGVQTQAEAGYAMQPVVKAKRDCPICGGTGKTGGDPITSRTCECVRGQLAVLLRAGQIAYDQEVIVEPGY